MTRLCAAIVLVCLAGCSDDSSPQRDGADADAVDATEAEVHDAPDAEFLPDAEATDTPDAEEADAPDLDTPDAADAPDDGTPPGTLFDDMVLGASGGSLVRPDGSPVAFRGAISCCMGGYGWPLFDEAWADYVGSKAVNFLHVRLGPFLTGDGGESDWAAVGGGYVETGGRADLETWNEAFWSRVRELLEYAGDRGMWVEVDVADGWAIKHCRWGDQPGYSAWDAAYNIQAEDWCATAGSREILGSDVHEAWVRKVVRETGRYGNVLYEDGNEIGLVDGYVPEWTLSIRNILHDEEARNGYRTHLLGTNSGDAVTMQAEGVEYIEFHRNTAVDAGSCYGRPCLVNEYNPSPSLTPDELHAQYCAALAGGTYFWYWRHGQIDADMEQTLSLIQAGCG
jgi:hypothetical protein